MKEKYQKPKVETLGNQLINSQYSMKDVRRHFRAKDESTTVAYSRTKKNEEWHTDEQVAIQHLLFSGGVSVERPWGEKTIGDDRVMGYDSVGEEGERLDNLAGWGYLKISKERIENFSKQIVDIMAELHNRNISHGHPHTANWYVKDEKMVLIDFSKAKNNRGIEWDNPETVFEAFAEDYQFLCRLFKSYKLDSNKIDTLIEKYKFMSDADKEKLIKKVKKHFL